MSILSGPVGMAILRIEKDMKTLLIQFVMAVYLCSTVSIAKAENDDSQVEKDLDFNGSDCIWIRSIRDYTPLDSRTLLIWGGSARPYFVRMSTSSREMDTGIGIAVHSRDDRLCPYGGDGLIFSTFDPRPVTILSITRITKEQAEDILVRYGKRETDEPQTPAPKEVDGAEVEELG
jgi:hypothetical protein